jgi:hypothetical protein
MTDEIKGTRGPVEPRKPGWQRHGEKIDNAALELRKWQRHVLLRTYGDNGQVLPENLAISEHLDTVLSALGSE